MTIPLREMSLPSTLIKAGPSRSDLHTNSLNSSRSRLLKIQIQRFLMRMRIKFINTSWCNVKCRGSENNTESTQTPKSLNQINNTTATWQTRMIVQVIWALMTLKMAWMVWTMGRPVTWVSRVTLVWARACRVIIRTRIKGLRHSAIQSTPSTLNNINREAVSSSCVLVMQFDFYAKLLIINNVATSVVEIPTWEECRRGQLPKGLFERAARFETRHRWC